MLNCRINSIVREEADAVIVELESGVILGSGQILELGDCYCGLVVVGSCHHDKNNHPFD